ncbi:MAG: HAD family phosphatase [Draconibacterium sp.]|nr:HAD family phosphatase [Draconibacterium sp.]
MIKIKAVIFDMDGVLVDSEPFHIQNEKMMFKKLGLDISDEEHAGYMGAATDVMWEQIIRNKKLKLDISETTALTIKESLPFLRSLPEIEPMPGLTDLLEKLNENQIPMAVASSSDPETIEIMLTKSGLKKYFKYAVSSVEAGKSKPEPDVFLYAAKLMNVSPENCLVIEDSKNGIKAAKAAKMLCIAYSGASSGEQDQSQADMHCSHFLKLKKKYWI